MQPGPGAGAAPRADLPPGHFTRGTPRPSPLVARVWVKCRSGRARGQERTEGSPPLQRGLRRRLWLGHRQGISFGLKDPSPACERLKETQERGRGVGRGNALSHLCSMEADE